MKERKSMVERICDGSESTEDVHDKLVQKDAIQR